MSYQITLAATTSPQPLPHFQGNQVLNRQRAQLKLQRLTPGTEEYYKLQNALIRTAGIAEINLPTATYKINTASEDCVLLGGFGSSEHLEIGVEVKLRGLEENTPLLVKGETPILFQDIVTLAGDYYGIAGKAISLPGGSPQEKTERFKNAFNTLAEADNDELQRVCLEIKNECTAVKQTGLPHHCYSSEMMERNNAIKKIKKDFNELLIDNSDHFSKNAEDAYAIGHAHAISVAREAGKQNDLEKLKEAYALDAFACHFLTDLFAAGHIRNQRGELETFLKSELKYSEKKAKGYAGILTAAQHEEDGKGLNVSDKNDNRWRAFGDGHFFLPKNRENKKKTIIATQTSVDEIYHAYRNPHSPVQSTVDQLIPYATDDNPPPLYSIENTSLFLNQDSNKIKIENKGDFKGKCIQLALKYLPARHIFGFVKGYLNPLNMKIPPVLDKVFFPLIEDTTGIIWRIVGVATYSQVKQENKQLNEKIDEIADTLKTMSEDTLKILEQIKNVNSQLNLNRWTTISKEIQDPIGTIKNMAHQLKHKDALNEKQMEQVENNLWDAYNIISRVFCEEEKGADETNLLHAYEMILTTNEMNLSEIKISVTLWFQQMLYYQVQAISLYETVLAMNGCQENKLQERKSKYRSDFVDQLKTNEKYIDVTLIDKTQDYIKLQLEKSRIISNFIASKQGIQYE
jgi:hypothetical protein